MLEACLGHDSPNGNNVLLDYVSFKHIGTVFTGMGLLRNG